MISSSGSAQKHLKFDLEISQTHSKNNIKHTLTAIAAQMNTNLTPVAQTHRFSSTHTRSYTSTRFN